MKMVVPAALGALVASSVIGWYAPDVFGRTEPTAAATAPAAPAIVHARETLAAAAFFFRTPTPPVETSTPDAAPIEPDVAATFRSALTALVDERGRRVAVIVDASAPSGRRTLRVGSAFANGWRVARIAEDGVELRRRGEVRFVSAFAPPPGVDTQGEPSAFNADASAAPPPSGARQTLTRASARSALQEDR